MSNKTLFQEAIADAKAVREAALANAKAALEESMTPRLQSMISARLEENYDELEEEDFMQPLDTGDEMQQSGFGNKEQGKPGHGDTMEEDLDLSEILAELEAEGQLEEAKKKEDEETEDKETEDEETEDEEAEDEEAEDEEAPEEGDEEEAEPTKVKDMTDEELIDLIKDIVQQEMEAEEAEMPADEAGEEEQGAEMDQMSMEPTQGNEEEININELLAELDEMDKDVKEEEEPKAAKAEMEEALSVINTLRNELNEVNLLNAKLLYVNKIFKAKSLTESQKVHVIASFDKATTIKEAKIVFESLNTALTAPKKQIKESLGFASRAAGIAPRQQQIVESNDAITRMQKLANIIK
jgi:hypothetical protein